MNNSAGRMTPKLALMWSALPKTGEGFTADELVTSTGASLPYLRRVLRQLAAAGYVDRTDKGSGRSDAHRYRRSATSPDIAPSILTDGTAVSNEPAMSASEFATRRRLSGHSLASFGRRLGWTGKGPTISRAMRRYEKGDRTIDASLADRVRGIERDDAEFTAPPR